MVMERTLQDINLATLLKDTQDTRKGSDIGETIRLICLSAQCQSTPIEPSVLFKRVCGQQGIKWILDSLDYLLSSPNNIYPFLCLRAALPRQCLEGLNGEELMSVILTLSRVAKFGFTLYDDKNFFNTYDEKDFFNTHDEEDKAGVVCNEEYCIAHDEDESCNVLPKINSCVDKKSSYFHLLARHFGFFTSSNDPYVFWMWRWGDGINLDYTRHAVGNDLLVGLKQKELQSVVYRCVASWDKSALLQKFYGVSPADLIALLRYMPQITDVVEPMAYLGEVSCVGGDLLDALSLKNFVPAKPVEKIHFYVMSTNTQTLPKLDSNDVRRRSLNSDLDLQGKVGCAYDSEDWDDLKFLGWTSERRNTSMAFINYNLFLLKKKKMKQVLDNAKTHCGIVVINVPKVNMDFSLDLVDANLDCVQKSTSSGISTTEIIVSTCQKTEDDLFSSDKRNSTFRKMAIVYNYSIDFLAKQLLKLGAKNLHVMAVGSALTQWESVTTDVPILKQLDENIVRDGRLFLVADFTGDGN